MKFKRGDVVWVDPGTYAERVGIVLWRSELASSSFVVLIGHRKLVLPEARLEAV